MFNKELKSNDLSNEVIAAFRAKFEGSSISEKKRILFDEGEKAKKCGIFENYDIITILKYQDNYFKDHDLKIFLNKNYQLLTPYQFVYLLGDLFKNHDTIYLIEFLDRNDWCNFGKSISLYDLVENDKAAANFILDSALLLSAISKKDFQKLAEKWQRNITKEFKDNVSIQHDLAFIKKDIKELIDYFIENLSQDLRHELFFTEQKEDDKNFHLNRIEELINYLEELKSKFENLSSKELNKKIDEVHEILTQFFKSDVYPSKFLKSVQSYYLFALSDLSAIVHYLKGQAPHAESYESAKRSFFRLKKVFVENVMPDETRDIPKEIHYHWYGKAMPAEYVKNIKLTQSFAPNFKIRIFTDNPKHLFDKAQTGVEGSPDISGTAFSVQTLQDLLKDVKKYFTPVAFHWVQKILNQEGVGLLNYAAVSDLTRLLSLLAYGGVYLDTDVVPTKQIELPDSTDKFFRADRNNCILIASPQHPEILRVISRFIDNYIRMTREKMNYRDPFENSLFDDNYAFQSHDSFYDKNLPLPSLLDCRRSPNKMHPEGYQSHSRLKLTVYTTGPHLYQNARDLGENKEIVPEKINKRLAGQYATKSNFGGFFTSYFHRPPRQTQHAIFPHYAFLVTS